MNLVKPIKIFREKCDGSPREEVSVRTGIYNIIDEVNNRKSSGQFEKVSKKIDILCEIISLLADSAIVAKESMEDLINTFSNESEYYHYYLEEDDHETFN